MSIYYTRFQHLAIERAKPPPTKEQLAAIEDLLGARLPSSFLEFLQVANGGYLGYVVDIPFEVGKSEPLSFCSIFSAENGDFCDETFVGEIRSSREYQKIPSGVLPFARDGGGSMVYLDLSAEGNGRVVAFVEGLPEWTGLRTKSDYIEVASSFDDYVKKLRIDRETVIYQLAHDDDTKTVGHLDATEEWLDIGMPSWREDPDVVTALREARHQVKSGG